MRCDASEPFVELPEYRQFRDAWTHAFKLLWNARPPDGTRVKELRYTHHGLPYQPATAPGKTANAPPPAGGD